MKRILISAMSALCLTACGGSSACDETIGKILACSRAFGDSPTDAEIAAAKATCERATCTGEKQTALGCINAAQCGTDPTAYEASIDACLTANGCRAEDL